MGLVTSQMHLVYLKQYQSVLQFDIEKITKTKLNIVSSQNQIASMSTDWDPNSPEMKVLNERAEKLKNIEAKLDAELEKKKLLLNAISTEIQSAQKFVDTDIQDTFNYAK